MLVVSPDFPCSGSKREDTPGKASWDVLALATSSADLTEQWKQEQLLNNKLRENCWNGVVHSSVLSKGA